MTYKKFIELLKNTKPISYQLPASKAEYWFNKYFKYYKDSELEKVFNYLEENGMDFNLFNIFETIKEFYSVLLHEEIEKASFLLERAKKKKLKLTENPPDIGLPLPVKRAWKYVRKDV